MESKKHIIYKLIRIKDGTNMRNKKKYLSVILIFAFTFCLSTNIAVSVEAVTSKVAQAIVKVSASVNNITPLQNATINVMVNGPSTSSVTILCHYKSTKTTYKSMINSSGKVAIPVKIGRASKGYAVVIDVSVIYKGKVYNTKTSFTPK